MDLTPWHPFGEIERLRHDVDRLWSNLPGLNWLRGDFNQPRLEMYETDKEIIVNAELAGMDKQDINISVNDNRLTLSGEVKRTAENKDDRYYHTERYYGSFSRTIPLPVEVDEDKITAHYDKGILKIVMPKAVPGRGKGRRIDIQ